MVGLGAVLAGCLVAANKKLAVDEDPRIDDVEGMLPGNNCGACGEPGCRAFAEKAVLGEISVAKCTVSSPDALDAIAGYLGVAVGSADRRVARLACAGGSNVARRRARYRGMKSCLAAAAVTGGGKGCVWGCLGLGDCEAVCDFDAIRMSPAALPVVDDDLCTACGDCVAICPKDLFSLQSAANRLWVACRNPASGEDAERECLVACTACGLCAADAAPGLIAMRDGLPVVDYSRSAAANTDCIDRCPTGAIVWLAEGGKILKGKRARRILREEPLPIG